MKKIVLFCLLSIKLLYAHETVIDTVQGPAGKIEQTPAAIESDIGKDSDEVDFDNLTDQMENSGLDFTVEHPSKLQLLLRRLGQYVIPLLPYYLTMQKWTAKKLSRLNNMRKQTEKRLFSLLTDYFIADE